MFKLSEIKELIKLIDQTSVQEIEIENEGSRLLIRKPNQTESVVVPSAPAQHHYAPVIAQPVQHIAPISAQGTPEPAAMPDKSATQAADLHKIVSPMVGTFYMSPSPGTPPFISNGEKVKEKSIVCIIEAMKLMNEIEAEVKGVIVDILAENGQLVEYGQPLFLVKPE